MGAKRVRRGCEQRNNYTFAHCPSFRTPEHTLSHPAFRVFGQSLSACLSVCVDYMSKGYNFLISVFGAFSPCGTGSYSTFLLKVHQFIGHSTTPCPKPVFLIFPPMWYRFLQCFLTRRGSCCTASCTEHSNSINVQLMCSEYRTLLNFSIKRDILQLYWALVLALVQAQNKATKRVREIVLSRTPSHL